MAKYDEGRYDLRAGGIRKIDNSVAIIESIESNLSFENAICLVGFAASNYYHFVVEFILRLTRALDLNEYDEYIILVDKIITQIPQYNNMLEIINKKKLKIVPIEKNKEYNVKNLIYPSYNSWLPLNIKKGKETKEEDFMISDIAIKSVSNILKNEFLKEEIISIKNRKKIFISRKGTKVNRIINENKVIEISKKYGFEVVYPEELSLGEQINLFNDSEYIIGATGAAFTNIMFCKENTKIICIIPEKYKFYGYSTISNIFNLDNRFIDVKIVTKKEATSQESYEIDLIEYEKILKGILN